MAFVECAGNSAPMFSNQPFQGTVQALHGPIDSEGRFVNHPAIVPLRHTGGRTWTAEYSIGEAGPYGVTVRAIETWGDYRTNETTFDNVRVPKDYLVGEVVHRGDARRVGELMATSARCAEVVKSGHFMATTDRKSVV